MWILFSSTLSAVIIILIELIWFILGDLQRYNLLDVRYKNFDKVSDERYSCLLSDFKIYITALLFVLYFMIPISAMFGNKEDAWNSWVATLICGIFGLILLVKAWEEHYIIWEKMKKILCRIVIWIGTALLVFLILFIQNKEAIITVSYEKMGR